MSIQFFIKQGERMYHSGSQACWVCVDSFIEEDLHECAHGNEFDDEEPWSIVLDLRVGSFYGQRNTAAERRMMDTCFDMLWGKILEGQYTSTYNKKTGARTHLEFHPSVPFPVLAAAAGMYRMKHDCMSRFNENWEMYQEYDLRAWTKYWLTMQVGNNSHIETIWGDKGDVFNTSAVCGHTPISGAFGDWPVIRRLDRLTWADVHKDLPVGYWQEFQDQNYLNLNGRDNYMCFGDIPNGQSPPRRPQEQTWIRRMGMQSGHWKEWTWETGMKSPYTGELIIKQQQGFKYYRDFIINVVVPLDRSKR
jgi:hypothetical protein